MMSLRDTWLKLGLTYPPNEFGGYKYAVPTGR
jgi:hypothetical protein